MMKAPKRLGRGEEFETSAPRGGCKSLDDEAGSLRINSEEEVTFLPIAMDNSSIPISYIQLAGVRNLCKDVEVAVP